MISELLSDSILVEPIKRGPLMLLPIFDPNKIIPEFDRFLANRGEQLKAVVIGGAALTLLGIIDRGTRDVDLLEATIPDDIRLAAREFAEKHSLSRDWLNTGPSSLVRDLPADWSTNLQSIYSGKALELWTLSRIDLIRTKLWAMCDRMRDLEDLVKLAPSNEELALAADWVKPLDTNPSWSVHVDSMVAAIKKRLSHD